MSIYNTNLGWADYPLANYIPADSNKGNETGLDRSFTVSFKDCDSTLLVTITISFIFQDKFNTT